VQLTTETIEGIKYVKLYGWETAFKRIIEKVREKEIEGLKRVAFGRSIDRSLAYVIGFISTFVMYVLAYEVNNALTFTIIFSTLEIMASLKQRLTSWILGIGLYY
jgi:ATP-binding cassette, subfamily C (CFTR/MRP), member 1